MFKWVSKPHPSAEQLKTKALGGLTRRLGSVIAVVMTFTLGYAVKNMEDSQAQRQMRDQLTQQRKEDVAICDARIVRSDQDAKDVLLERDRLLADQTGRIADQTILIQQLQGATQQLSNTAQQLTNTTASIAQKQDQGIKARKNELHTITKAAEDAKVAVTTAQTLTAGERNQINDAVKKGVKK